MFFVETTPRMFCLNKQFRLKNQHVAKDTLNETNFVGNSKMESTTLLKIKLNLIVLSTKVKRHFTD